LIQAAIPANARLEPIIHSEAIDGEARIVRYGKIWQSSYSAAGGQLRVDCGHQTRVIRRHIGRKPRHDLALAIDQELRAAADFRGGQCLADHVANPYTKLPWRCPLGHEFDMSANLMLAGGHWCPVCMIDPGCYARVAQLSPYFRQVWQESVQ